jgi:hypothetical protein
VRCCRKQEVAFDERLLPHCLREARCACAPGRATWEDGLEAAATEAEIREGKPVILLTYAGAGPRHPEPAARHRRPRAVK